MSFENPTSQTEQISLPKLDVENKYADFLPDEFKTDPLGYFERQGINVKSGEIKYDEEGKAREDPTAVKDLPVWTKPGGETLETVGKRVNVEKSQVGKSEDPFYEYEIMEIVAEFALPAPRPVAKVEQEGKHLIIMERVFGIRWTEESMKAIHESDLTENDKQELLKQAEEKMQKLQAKYESIGLNRTWKIKDMVVGIDIGEKKVDSITPTDWERTKIDQEKLAESQRKIHEATARLHDQLKESIQFHLEKVKRDYPEELEAMGSSDPDVITDIYIKRMVEEGGEGKDYLELTKFTDTISKYKDLIKSIGVYPHFFSDAFDDWVRGKDTFVDQKMMSSYVYNHTLRSKEKIEDQPMRMKLRLERAPLADDNEVNAGVYREELEPQVSDAIFLMRKKGYETFQSGFEDLTDGSQFVDFNTEDFEANIEQLRNLLTSEATRNIFNEDGIEINVEKSHDRLTVRLIPKDPQTPLQKWKRIWDTFAQLLPDRDHIAPPPMRLGSYGTFMEKQTKIRDGQKTYIGFGMEFDGHRAVKKTQNE